MTTKKRATRKPAKKKPPRAMAPEPEPTMTDKIRGTIQALRADRDGYAAIRELPVMGAVDVFGCRVIRVAGARYKFIYSDHPYAGFSASASEVENDLAYAIGRCDEIIRAAEQFLQQNDQEQLPPKSGATPRKGVVGG